MRSRDGRSAGAVGPTAGSAAADATAAILTNAGGHFVVRGLHKGSLALTATKNGYIEGTYGQRHPGGSRQLMAIDEGQRLIDLEIRMWRHAVITAPSSTKPAEPVDPGPRARVQTYARRRQATGSGRWRRY
jgi:hypothetical protein